MGSLFKPMFFHYVPLTHPPENPNRVNHSFHPKKAKDVAFVLSRRLQRVAFQLLQAAKKPQAAAMVKAAAKQQVSLIDSKRAYNISILMNGKIKIPIDELRDAVLAMDVRVSGSEETLAALMQCLPTAEDKITLGTYKAEGKDLEALGDAERIMLQLMDVPALDARLRCCSYKFATPAKLQGACDVMQANMRAVTEMRSSHLFHRCLWAALDAGNFLNHGSRLGNAVGFRLKNLPKLAETRASDGKTTLLQVICAEIMKENDRLLTDEMGGLLDPQLKVSQAEANAALSDAKSQIEQVPCVLSFTCRLRMFLATMNVYPGPVGYISIPIVPEVQTQLQCLHS